MLVVNAELEVWGGGGRTGYAVAVEHAEAGAEGREEEELHDAAGDAVDGVDSTDLIRAEAEAAGEFEGEVHIGIVRVYAWVVEKDGEDLVVGDGVQGQEGVREKIDAGLAGEDLGVTGAFGFDGDLIGAGHG